jgi:hypothetical protein
MNFYVCIRDYKDIKPGEIVVNSLRHWGRTVVVATPTAKTKYLNHRITMLELMGEEFSELTYKELTKLRHHITIGITMDYINAYNELKLTLLPKLCCYACGIMVFGTDPKIKPIHTIGTCYACGKPGQELTKAEYFKLGGLYPKEVLGEIKAKAI